MRRRRIRTTEAGTTRGPTAVPVDRRQLLHAGTALASALVLPKIADTPAAAAGYSTGGNTAMSYQLEGRILEACNCKVLCPCWIGEDPDYGTCEAMVAWHIDQGAIDGLDVSDRTLALISHIPGNILQGNWKAVVYVDDGASPAQQEALVNAWSGKLGGPLADLAQLVGEVVGVERAPITFAVDQGKGTLRIGESVRPVLEAELAPFQGATGHPTTLLDTVFSTIPGSPAYVSKAARYRRNTAQHGLRDVDIEGHNAIQGTFSFVA
jgi:hypothetical protein